MNEHKELLTTTQKALTINLDGPKYGTFAEIGAGQEVAREFFHAGGACEQAGRECRRLIQRRVADGQLQTFQLLIHFFQFRACRL